MPPPANINSATTGIASWYYSQPPITRAYAVAIFITTLMSRFQPASLMFIALRWGSVLNRFQLWRLLTCFLYAGKFSFNWLIKMIWLLSYGGNLENQTYRFEPANYAMLIFFGMTLSVVISFGAMLLGAPVYFLADAMIYMLLYSWSRNFPEVQVSIYGLFKVMSFYVPFVFVALEVIMGGSVPIEGIIGLLVGHAHYFLTVLRPAMGRRNLIRPPAFLVDYLARQGIGRPATPPPATAESQAAGSGGFRAFHGHGQRLGR